MQTLKFLGNGSGFTDSHTNAFFELENKIILIDISMLNVQKFLKLKPYEKETFVLITHMHDDHISGLAMLIQYYFYVYKKKLRILVPEQLSEDVLIDLTIKGISSDIFILRVLNNNFSFVKEVILTTHAPELEGKCFSYLFEIDNKRILYTGDTNTLLPYKNIKNIDEFYVDISYSYGGVHLKYDDIKEDLNSMNSEVFLMHIDQMDEMKEAIKYTKLKIAKTIS